MADDRLRDMVASAAGRPAGDVPMQRILGRARRRRRTRRLTAAAVPLAGLLVAGIALVATVPQARIEFLPADEPDGAGVTAPEEPEPGTPPAVPTPSPTGTPASPASPQDDPEPETTPTEAPSASEDPPGIAPPAALVVTDGVVIEQRDTVSGALGWSMEAAGDGEQVQAVAVRPGSTPEDLDLVYTVSGPDGFSLGWLTVTGGGQPDLRRGVDGAAAVSGDAASGSEPWPVWSPDGSTLAWVELPADEAAAGPRLRIAEWDAGARVAVDAAALTLEDLPLQVIRAETLAAGLDGDAAGELQLYLSSWTLEAWRVGLARGDAGWEVAGPAVLLTSADTLGGGLPVAVGRDDGPGAAYFLTALDADAAGVVRLALNDVSGHQALPLEAAAETAEPAAVWIEGGGQHVLVGDGEHAWVTSRPDGLRRAVDGTVRHASWVR